MTPASLAGRRSCIWFTPNPACALQPEPQSQLGSPKEIDKQCPSWLRLGIAREKEKKVLIRRPKSHGKDEQAGCAGAGAGNGDAIGASSRSSLSPPLLLGLQVFLAARLSVRLLHCLCGPARSAYSGIFLFLHPLGSHVTHTPTLFLPCLSLSFPLLTD